MDDTSNFGVSTVRDALADVTNVQNTKNIEASALAREKGRVEPKDYDYEKYVTVIPSEKHVENGENSQNEQSIPEWAAKTAKYEWNDEYGDVGPENPHLEEQLFRAEFINRTGLKIGK
jgi:ATP-dependent RNA helicase DDX3X